MATRKPVVLNAGVHQQLQAGDVLDTAASFGTQTPNFMLAGPASGGAAAPTFRALVTADLTPALSIGATVTTGTPNSILFLGAAGVIAQDNANLKYDGTTLTINKNIYQNLNSASALIVEQNGVYNNLLTIDAANGRIGIGKVPTSLIDVAGYTPASVTTTPGVTASAISFIGGTGGATTNINGVGGVGGSLTFQGGIGGVSSSIGGLGGSITLQSGVGGIGTNSNGGTGGNGGVIQLIGGAGATETVAGVSAGIGGNGGGVQFTSGTGGAANGLITGATSGNTGGNGGNVAVVLGSGGAASNSLNNIGGNAANFNVTCSPGGAAVGGGGGISSLPVGGNGGGGTFTASAGGAATSASNNGAFGGPGGSWTIIAGAGGAATGTGTIVRTGGAGGSISMRSGAGGVGGATNVYGQAGNISFTAAVSSKLSLNGIITFAAGVAAGVGLTITGPISGLPSVVVGGSAIPTNAADGFLYIPSCAGQPSGGPTPQLATIPLVFDSTSNRLKAYNGGWLDALPAFVAAGASHIPGLVTDPGVSVQSFARSLLDTGGWGWKPGEILASNYVATSETTTSAGAVDLTTADSVTFVLDATANVIILYKCTESLTFAGTGSTFNQLMFDGVADGLSQTQLDHIAAQSGFLGPNVLIYRKTGLTAGSHTIKVQHSTNVGTAAWQKRSLIAFRSP